MIGGVCGGLGDYLSVDPTVLRVIFVVTLFFGGAGAVAYLVLWLIIPEEPDAHQDTQQSQGRANGTAQGPSSPPPPGP